MPEFKQEGSRSLLSDLGAEDDTGHDDQSTRVLAVSGFDLGHQKLKVVASHDIGQPFREVYFFLVCVGLLLDIQVLVDFVVEQILVIDRLVLFGELFHDATLEFVLVSRVDCFQEERLKGLVAHAD